MPLPRGFISGQIVGFQLLLAALVSAQATAHTALRFERYLGISAGLLIRLQAEYALSKAIADKGPQIQREILPAAELAVA